jgi:hypothetical protein
MLPPDGQSDRFLATKVLKLVGCRREKYVFCYVPAAYGVADVVRRIADGR